MMNASVYEAMINWPKRLENEAPLFREVFQQVGAQRVVDLACGTGHHANLFHQWGLHVEGSDLSDAMIAHCRQRWGQSESLRWRVRGFAEPVDSAAGFDVAICVGNSLALAPNHEAAAAGLRNMFRAIRPGGAVVVHVLNLHRLESGPCIWQKSLRIDLAGTGDVLILKGVHRCGDSGYVNFVVIPVNNPAAVQSESVPFLGFDAPRLEQSVRDMGAASVELFGDYRRNPYDPASSQDLIMVAIKG